MPDWACSPTPRTSQTSRFPHEEPYHLVLRACNFGSWKMVVALIVTIPPLQISRLLGVPVCKITWLYKADLALRPGVENPLSAGLIQDALKSVIVS